MWLLFLLICTSIGVFFSCNKGDDDKTYLTMPLPILTTTAISNLSPTKVTSGGNITSDGGLPIIARGVCWSRDGIPTVLDFKTIDGDSTGSFTSTASGLISSASYQMRAYASNRVFTGYGDVIYFITPNEFVTDIDGNNYHQIKIGTQVWLVENLKVTRYRNGDPIAKVNDAYAWSHISTGAYCDYNNDANNATVYGRLYNFSVVKDARNIAPYGWHVATDSDWSNLISYVGGSQTAGQQLKEIGLVHWQGNTLGTTNSSGFTGLPDGSCSYLDGSFKDIGKTGYWWSMSSLNTSSYFCYKLSGNSNAIICTQEYSYNGFSVRCIKN